LKGLLKMKKLLAVLGSCLLLMGISASPSSAANNPRNMYDVKPGDTLWKIAGTYKTSPDELKKINGLQTSLLLPGQKLRVPIMYEVKSGDTLWKLSQSFSSDVGAIKKVNRIASDRIYTGQKLRIPPKKLQMEGQFVLMTREEFQDWIFNHKFTRKVGKIQQHHTFQPSYEQFNGSNHFSMLKGMKEYHVTGMGWKDISQHLTTFPDGRVAVGRSFNIAPEGSFGLQNKAAMHRIEADSIAIENVGNFDKNKMTKEQKETITAVTALLMLKYGLTPSVNTITYHHWWDINTGEKVLDKSSGHAVKTCPGTEFFGGNSTEDAKKSFYPLVERKMKEISASVR
jgi:LysM repeat protein